MKYGVFMGAVGGIASFVGPFDSGINNAFSGVAVGGILLGRRFEDALKEFIKANNELADEIFDN